MASAGRSGLPLHPSSCAVPIDLSATVGQDDQAPDGLVGLRDAAAF